MSDDLEAELRDGLHRATGNLPTLVAPRPGLLEQVRGRRRRRLLGLTAGCAVVLIGLVAGLVSLRAGPTTETIAAAPGSTDPLAGAAPDSWVRLLARAPKSYAIGSGPVSIVDLARARRQAGVDVLPAGASAQDITAHLEAIFQSGSVPPIEPTGATPDELRAALGFSQDQIDQIITVQGAPVRFVAVGRFDATQIAAAVRADPVWGPRLESKTYRGLSYYSWGKDHLQTRDRGAVRPLGQGGRLVVGDGWLSWSTADADAQASIDAYLDTTRSLASVDSIRVAAQAGDDAQLTVFTVFDAERAEVTMTKRPAPKPGLPPIDRPMGWSGGTRRSAQGNADVFMLAYPSEAAASANLDAFTRTLRSFDSSAKVAVDKRGAVLVATLISAPGEPVRMVGELADGTRDPLNPGNFYMFLNARDGQAMRPTLPERRPTQAEILADGVVTPGEYEVAFWTFVECAEAAGESFSKISRESNGSYRYSTTGAKGDACYRTNFREVDMAWQLAH